MSDGSGSEVWMEATQCGSGRTAIYMCGKWMSVVRIAVGDVAMLADEGVAMFLDGRWMRPKETYGCAVSFDGGTRALYVASSIHR